MKKYFPISCLRVFLSAFALALSLNVSRADTPVLLQTFDDTNSFSTVATYNPPPIIARFEFASNPTPNATHSIGWSTNDAHTNANSGSLKLSWDWNHTADGDGGVLFAIDLFNQANTISNASRLSFDVMVDPASAQDTFGGYGYFEVVTRDANYVFNKISYFNDELGNPTYGQNIAGTWEHFDIPLTGVYTNVRAISLQDYNDSRNINGTVTIYIDNLTLSVPGQLTNILAIASPPSPNGLHLLTSTASTVDIPQYQRQDLRSVANTGYGFIGAANPVTYSLTITNYPLPPFTNFLSYIMLVPGTPTGPNPDYADPHVIYLDIQNQNDGSAVGTFRYKVNESGGNSMLYGSGTLGSVSSPSPLGTWSMTFSQDTNVTVTAPGGATLNTNIPDFDVVNFTEPLTVYFGDQPNLTGNVGQRAVYSRFQIVSNSVTVLNDNFTSPTLNTAIWQVIAEDPTGVLQVPPTAKFLLSWNLPDTGMALSMTSNLLNPAGWHSPALPLTIFNGRRTTLIPASLVATNSAGFFRLAQ